MRQSGGYILGIDQGGTKTAAAVMRQDGCILGCAVAKGAYFPTQGMEAALAPVEKAAGEAVRMAAVEREDIALTVAGITGIDWPGDDAAVEKALRQKQFPGEIVACSDAVIALYSGTLRSHGVVICAGTGMNGALVDREGRRFVYGDYMEEAAQGGSALALRAARKVFDAQLGIGRDTALTKLFLERTSVPDVDALLRRYMTDETFRSELRFLVPEILGTAQRGDEVACSLLDEFAGEIVDYIAAGFYKMGMEPKEEEIVLAGSVFKGEENPLTKRVVAATQKRLAGARLAAARYEPVVGACVMGLVSLGIEPAECEKNLQDSAANLGLCCG